jgi:hypothetical protein
MKLRDLKFAAILACLAVPILMTGCGSSSSQNSSSSASSGISGNWQMSLTPAGSTSDPKYQSGFLVQSAETISGSVIVADNPCSGIGTVNGTVSGSDVSLVVTLSGITINLTGSVSGQDAMSGNYTVLSSGCEWSGVSPQTGTWTATQIPPLSGNITAGTLTAQGTPYTGITGQLTQGANTGVSTAALSGTISIPGYCFTSANVVGTISGTAVALNLLDSNGTQIGEITSTLNGSSLTGLLYYLGQGADGTKGCREPGGGNITLTM